MIFKNLGNTQVKIPAIGQGTAGFRTYPQEARKQIEALRLGIELGMAFIDTAEWYGDGYSEEIVAQAIDGIRDKAFIATKVSPRNLSYSNFVKSTEGSLRRLKIDYIDLYQIHWSNPGIPISETMRAMEDLKKQGKIRFIGVSNFSLREFEEAREASQVGIVSNQIEYNLFDRSIEDNVLPYCQQEGITIIAHTPLDHGRMANGEEKIKALQCIADKYNCTVAQIILNWLTNNTEVIAIPKASNINHVRENAASTAFHLADEDFNEIGRLSSQRYVYVPPERIRIINRDNRIDYQTIEEAKENRMGSSPSPMELAQSIKNGNVLKSVRLTPTRDKSGEYDYDLVGGGMRYWAHVIAYDGKVLIKALVRL